MKKFIPELSLIMLIAFLNLLSGCNYYMVNTVQKTPDNNTAINNTLTKPKYFILHYGEKVWHMDNIDVNEEKQEIKCRISQLTPDHHFYMHTKPTGVNRYKVNKEFPTYEVHIYISEFAQLNDSMVMVPVGAIQKIDMYDKAMGATTASYVFGTLGIISGALVVLVIIILLTKSSCPFVYTSDGIAYHFTGEMYGGSIYAPLERDDFMPLPGFKSVNSQYQLKISNELLERQYTDLAELMIVQHPLNSTVILDKFGEIQTISTPVTAQKVYADNGIDYTRELKSVDSSLFLFNEDKTDKNEFASMTMEFRKPVDAHNGKLILHAKNSLWLDYMYGEFNKLFGTSFNKFSKKQEHNPPEKMINWQLSQGIPLSIYLETENGWQFIDYFNTVGPLASRDLVMSIDVSKIKGDKLKLKMQCGFMFWEVDYAAMDFSDNIAVEVSKIAPENALDENGKNVTSLLAAKDKKYLIQPEVGNEVVVSYRSKASISGYRESVFLHSRGYYEYIREYKNKPDIAYLKSFREKGSFTRFSKEKYLKFVLDQKLISKALADGRN